MKKIILLYIFSNLIVFVFIKFHVPDFFTPKELPCFSSRRVVLLEESHLKKEVFSKITLSKAVRSSSIKVKKIQNILKSHFPDIIFRLRGGCPANLVQASLEDSREFRFVCSQEQSYMKELITDDEMEEYGIEDNKVDESLFVTEQKYRGRSLSEYTQYLEGAGGPIEIIFKNSESLKEVSLFVEGSAVFQVYFYGNKVQRYYYNRESVNTFSEDFLVHKDLSDEQLSALYGHRGVYLRAKDQKLVRGRDSFSMFLSDLCHKLSDEEACNAYKALSRIEYPFSKEIRHIMIDKIYDHL